MLGFHSHLERLPHSEEDIYQHTADFLHLLTETEKGKYPVWNYIIFDTGSNPSILHPKWKKGLVDVSVLYWPLADLALATTIQIQHCIKAGCPVLTLGGEGIFQNTADFLVAIWKDTIDSLYSAKTGWWHWRLQWDIYGVYLCGRGRGRETACTFVLCYLTSCCDHYPTIEQTGKIQHFDH